jgi:hypothetical protein
VRRHIGELGVLHNIAECLVAVLERLAIPLDGIVLSQLAPSPQVRQQPPWQRDGRLALLCLPLAFRPPEEDTAIEVDAAFPPRSASGRPRTPRLPVYLDGITLIEDDDRHE